MLSLSVLQVVLAVGASVVGARLAMRYGCDLRPATCGLGSLRMCRPFLCTR